MRNHTIIRNVLTFTVVGMLSNGVFASDVYRSPFVVNGDQVSDPKTNLTWQRCSVGKKWKEGTGCVGQAKLFTWDEAQRQGNGQWRVPTKEEMATLVDPDRFNLWPSLDIEAFPELAQEHDMARLLFWTTSQNDPTFAWYMSFAGSDNGISYHNAKYAVRLVRSGQ